jgi:hypothetical protein
MKRKQGRLFMAKGLSKSSVSVKHKNRYLQNKHETSLILQQYNLSIKSQRDDTLVGKQKQKRRYKNPRGMTLWYE